MAKITMELIKELREKTQVGMMDCKKALISADGDMETPDGAYAETAAATVADDAINVWV